MNRFLFRTASVLALTLVSAPTAHAGSIYDYYFGYYPTVSTSVSGWNPTYSSFNVTYGYRLSQVTAYASAGPSWDYESRVGFTVTADADASFGGSSAHAEASAIAAPNHWLWGYSGLTYYRTYTSTTGPGTYARATARPISWWRFSYVMPWSYWTSWGYNYVPFYMNYWHWGPHWDPPILDIDITDDNAAVPALTQHLVLTGAGANPENGDPGTQLSFDLQPTVVDLGDGNVALEFNMTADVASNIPEPGSMALLLAGAALLSMRRVGRR